MTFERFRRLCLAMPEAEERETWGEATFRVGNRIFAMGSSSGAHVSVKASLDDQAGLVAMDPTTFAVSAYTGRFGWVRVRLAGLGLELGERLVAGAWERTAPKRLVAASTMSKKAIPADSRRRR
ncbi:MAG TPA: MmcQ/YjbR family DNA-binding protein [Candidatus Dormibacteraeota bacterium]|nr:MmcQ/YjbR family DNA-binding protein [Candidatus Dormibacteraeota bacterium]